METLVLYSRVYAAAIGVSVVLGLLHCCFVGCVAASCC